MAQIFLKPKKFNNFVDYLVLKKMVYNYPFFKRELHTDVFPKITV